jgi:hypothetical protein
VASTMLGMASYANDTTSGSEAMQAMILMQGEGGTIVENSIYGNATTWGNPLDLSGTGLNNLVILPINTVSAIHPRLVLSRGPHNDPCSVS